MIKSWLSWRQHVFNWVCIFDFFYLNLNDKIHLHTNITRIVNRYKGFMLLKRTKHTSGRSTPIKYKTFSINLVANVSLNNNNTSFVILVYLKTVGKYILLTGLNFPLKMQCCSCTIEWCSYWLFLLADRQLTKKSTVWTRSWK